MSFREKNFGQTVVTASGVCVFTQQPCAEGMCEQYDPFGDQCGIRSMGMAASMFIEFYGPQIMGETNGEPGEQVLATETEVEADSSTGGEAGGSERADMDQVGARGIEAEGRQEQGHSGPDEEGQSG
jgi:hypothetical protein